MAARLVALDLDGTLIDQSLQIPPVDAAAIRRATDAGIAICLATGRLFAAALPFVQTLGLRAPVIALNGASVYGWQDGWSMLHAAPLVRATALAAYDDLKSSGFHVQLYYDDRLYLDAMNEKAKLYLQISPVEPVMVPDLRVLLTLQPPPLPGPMKVLAVGSPDEVWEHIGLLAAKLGSSANVFRSQRMFLEVTNPEATKGNALRWIAARLGVDPRETAAIGDSDNDVPMFKAAAVSFAVSTGTAAAKSAATKVVGGQGEGGVAEALDQVMHELTRGRS